MEYNKAKRIIKETFESAFDKEQFRRFIINLLNDVDSSSEAAFTYRGGSMRKAYRPYVSSMQRLGKFEDDSGKLIDVLVVKLKKESSLERARTMQRNLIGWYLNGSRNKKNAALVAFISPNSQDWRFSFVKMDYELVKQESGGVAAEQTFTPARRFSFLVGANEDSHTAQQQLVPVLTDDKHKPTLTELEDAFSVERVTKRFYEEYRELFLRLRSEIDRLEQNDEIIRRNFEKHHVDNVDFAKKLLGQIVFLYFLQKKGWFGVPKGGNWGSGPKQFLRELFEKKHADYSNFFNDILEPLFYEALADNRHVNDDYFSRFNCRIPFLNGGLFDPIQNYDWVNTDLLLPDDLFSNDEENGVLDVFDRYNFTVKENEPLEKEVAVDPEMLGKVFENLLEVKDRKSKGTYYTPREIVHYMCQESLINYLDTELDGKVKTDDLETFVRFGEQAIQNDRQVEMQEKETGRYKYKIPGLVRAHARMIDDKLASICICDPAAGSGAFLVGMMKEIVRKREVLNSYLPESSKRSVYNFKLNAIHNSLYGVDIDPGAVEIAKLRLWLSLVVEEEDIKNIKALPNLDYKIMQGNSLLEQYEGVKLIDERFFKKPKNNEYAVEQLKDQQLKFQREYIKLSQSRELTEAKEKEITGKLKKIKKRIKQYQNGEPKKGKTANIFDPGRAQKIANELLELQDQFFDLTRRDEKREMKQKIENKSWELIEQTLQEQNEIEKLEEVKALREKRQYPFFLWHLHFADVFQKNKGFDVVIGNPPYISIYNIEDQEKKNYKRIYETAYKKYDIYVLFFEKGLGLLKQEGGLTYITSNKYLSQPYGKNLRKLLLSNNIKEIMNFRLNVFKATVDTSILQTTKRKQKRNYFDVCQINNLKEFGNFTTKERSELPINLIENLPEKNFRLTLTNDKINLMNKIKKNSIILNDICYINYGCRLVSKNGNKKKSDYVFKKNSRGLKKFIEGKDIARYKIVDSKWVNYKSKEHYLPLFPELFNSNKIVAKEIVGKDGLQLALDEHGYYDDHTVVNAVPWHELQKVDHRGVKKDINKTKIANSKNYNLRYLLGVLNSKLNFWYFNELFNIDLHFYPKTFQNLIVPYGINNGHKKSLEQIINNLLAAKKKGNQQAQYSYENKINKLLYQFYNLTPGEIALVEESVNG
jgi:hypothetical protein